jgi:hypothetical protein
VGRGLRSATVIACSRGKIRRCEINEMESHRG